MALLAYIHIQLSGTARQIPAPVATFGAHAPAKWTGALVLAEPATAFPALNNAEAIRGKIAVVRRGECSFVAKAKSLQAAGAIAMVLTNSSEDLVRMGEAFPHEGDGIDIPVLMVGAALGKSLRDGMLVTVELKMEDRSKSFLQVSMDAVKKTVEHTGEVVQAGVDVVKKRVEVAVPKTIPPSKPRPEKTLPTSLAPLFAFVLYATSADAYVVQFAPLADFGLSRRRLYYRSRLALAHPLSAHTTLTNRSELPGAIVLVERGGCTFPEKIERAQQAGAIAVLVGNNDAANPDAAFVMSVDQLSADHISIPSVMLPYTASQALQKAPPESVGIVCLDGAAAGVLLAAQASSYSLWAPPPLVAASLPPLVTAARAGDIGAVTTLLETTPPHASDAYNVTALHHACIAGAADVVTRLLAAGAQVDAVDLGSQTPLHYACMAPSVACVEALLTAAAHTLALNEGGSSPLHVACFAGSTECMELLLTASATLDAEGRYHFHGVNDRDKSGRTPLHIACLHGHADCALYLMAAQAAVNIADARGWTPLHYVCDRLSSDGLHVVEQLLAYGADMVDRTTSAAKQPLVLDRIVDARLRREVEVLYLRQQVAAHEKAHAAHRSALDAQAAAYDAKLAAATETAQAVATACQAQLNMQARQMDHVQRQLSAVLQVLQTTSAAPMAAALPTAQNDLDETEKAQEAGLARDLGKKHLRQKQYDAAVSYLESSLAIFKLPGVPRLLQHARELRAADRRAVPNASPSGTQLAAVYHARLAALGAPAHALEALDAEVAALAGLAPGSAEYDATKQWLDWLLSLPWTDASVPVSRALFHRVNAVEAADANARRHTAAAVLQRAVRDRLAVRLWRREAAAVRIQALVRGALTRRSISDDADTTSSVHSDTDNNAPPLEAAPDNDAANGVDVESVVDPSCHQWAGRPGRVARGVRLAHCAGDKTCVLQWLVADEANQAQHFVWCRWGAKELVERTFKGPYDAGEDAERAFEWLFKLKTGTKWGAPVPPDAAWAIAKALEQ
ncbi:hypothetical protein ACHHYP_16575 [Achlya hypogyna]|uniref:PA domain-containing protein n=1 Tax=Achlya hypogyna TaxID=1202772 RepID=A0A1V9ZE30_ACHHY|nr:hypothetical protein ACHHYP_16575 [Achlya hypogyna]